MLNTEHVRDLLYDMPDDVLTFYLHVDPSHRPNQNTPPAWQIYIKNALREVEGRLSDPNAPIWHNIRTELDNYLRGYQPRGKSLVMFVSADGVHTHDLPIALENRHAYGEPLVVPLLWAIDEYEQYLVVLVDQEEAQFFSAYLGGADSDDELSIDFDAYDFRDKNYMNNSRAPSRGQPMAQGSGKDNFDDMHNAHLKRFHKDVAERIREVMGDKQAERIILGGNQKAAHAVRDHLHDSIKPNVVDILNIPISASEDDVAKGIRQTATNYERDHELEVVEEVINFAKANGRGALGVEAVEKAFTMQQVETLVMPFPPDDIDTASALTLRALHMGANVELVHGSPALKLKQEGNIAARLYYSIDES